jgi:hypothetical protein
MFLLISEFWQPRLSSSFRQTLGSYSLSHNDWIVAVDKDRMSEPTEYEFICSIGSSNVLLFPTDWFVPKTLERY